MNFKINKKKKVKQLSLQICILYVYSFSFCFNEYKHIYKIVLFHNTAKMYKKKEKKKRKCAIIAQMFQLMQVNHIQHTRRLMGKSVLEGKKTLSYAYLLIVCILIIIYYTKCFSFKLQNAKKKKKSNCKIIM